MSVRLDPRRLRSRRSTSDGVGGREPRLSRRAQRVRGEPQRRRSAALARGDRSHHAHGAGDASASARRSTPRTVTRWASSPAAKRKRPSAPIRARPDSRTDERPDVAERRAPVAQDPHAHGDDRPARDVDDDAPVLGRVPGVGDGVGEHGHAGWQTMWTGGRMTQEKPGRRGLYGPLVPWTVKSLPSCGSSMATSTRSPAGSTWRCRGCPTAPASTTSPTGTPAARRCTRRRSRHRPDGATQP